MILTRSIRRKLVIGLALVFAMLLLLSVAGLSAIWAYWGLIDDLRSSHNSDPQQTDLLNAIAGLAEPMVGSIPRRQGDGLPPEHMLPTFEESEFGKELWKEQPDHRVPHLDPDRVAMDPNVTRLGLMFHKELWDERISKAHNELAEFRRRCSNQLKFGTQQRILSDRSLDQIWHRLTELENRPKMARTFDEHLIGTMLLDVAQLETLVRQIPFKKNSIESALRASENEIQWRLWLIGSPTAIVLALFFSLTYFGYHWILIPIRRLHEAAARVANGDFTYRLNLRGKDEMVELADMFDKMTERFQSDKAKLAREVEERSRQILRNERLAGIGFFASGISHEINNPLQAIGAAAESLTSRLGDGSLGQELPVEDRELLGTYLGMIEREATRCQQITSRVLDFARGTNGPKSRQDLTKIVAEVLDMISHMSKFDNCTIVFDRTKPHPIDVSAAEMKQVILNLVANGLEAMDGAGTLTLQMTDLVDEVVLTITDEGCGMTAAVIENLYEPFFTDKQNGKGTGLGLSITHRIVGDHGGRIEASSEGPGCGSTFRVHLPRCAWPASISAA